MLRRTMFDMTCLSILVVPALILTGCHVSISDRKPVGDDDVKRAKAAELVIDKLVKLNKGDFYYQLHDGGGLRYMGGRNIAPTCVVPSELDEAKALMVLLDFIRSSLPLHVIDKKPPHVSVIRVTRIVEEKDGNTFVTARQFFGDIPVKGSEIKIVIHKGKMVQFSGQIFPEGTIPTFSRRYIESNRDSVLAAATKLTNYKLGLVERYFNVQSSSVISEFQVLDKTSLRVLFDERRMKVVSIRDVADYSIVAKQTIRMMYPRGFQEDTESLDSVGMTQYLVPLDNRCVVFLDHESDSDDGEPKVQLRPNGSTYARIMDCSTNAVFIDNVGLNTEEFAVSNVYYWMHDLAVFANHWQAAYDDWYDWDNYNSENLKVIVRPVNPDNENPHASMGSTEYEIHIPMIWGDNRNLNAARELATMAHEYGHVVHYMYDRNVDKEDCWEGQAIEEGFADHNVLRYMMYRWRENQLTLPAGTTFNYSSDLGQIRPYRHRTVCSNGEFLPDSFTFGSDYHLFHECGRYPCTSDLYGCGTVLAVVYWELAWNEFRTPYRGFAANSPILIDSNYRNDPERPANVAYTFAIKSLSESSKIEDFFGMVTRRYRQFRDNGDISPADYSRVVAVLNHHCVGWSNHCEDYHKLPGSKLPVHFTQKASFDAGDPEHLILARNMVREGSPAERPHGTPDGESCIRLDSPGDGIMANVNFPWTSYYEFHGVARSWTNCEDALFIQIDNDPPRRWDIVGDYCKYWQWSDSRARIYVPSGEHTVRILYNTQHIDVDAVLIRKTNCIPRTCATAGAECTRILDGCGGVLDCPCVIETIVTVNGETRAIAVDDEFVYFTVRDPEGDGRSGH